MTTFGFSAFLKYVSLSERRQRSELHRRLGPAQSSGYDFHKRMRQLAQDRLVDGRPMAEVLTLAGQITSVPERLSALAALERLETWRMEVSGEIVPVSSATYESPRGLFRVKFEPDFGLRVAGKSVAIHLWNTKTVKLADGPTYAALKIASQAYDGQDYPPDDVGVLSIREPARFYLLGDVSDRSVAAASIVDGLEEAVLGTASPPAEPSEYRPHP